MDRRTFLNSGLAAGAVVAGIGSEGFAAEDKKVTILGISCSPRKGKTTSTAVKVALEAAKTVNPRIQVDLLDLGGMNISGWSREAKPSAGMQTEDDFGRLLPLLRDPTVGGWIIGSPTYFRSMSALCKAFLERCAVLRAPKFLMADKPVGGLSVGDYRNGGQELVIQQIQTIMLCHEVMVVGGKPKAHQRATLWNAYSDDIMKDEFGIDSTKKLGIRVAEAALKLS